LGKNPLNLALRFFLELAGLVALGYYGWTQFDGVLRFLLVIGLPLLAAAVWGIFRVPGDGGPPIVRVPGILRLLIEVIYFASATWCLFAAGAVTAGWIFGTITLLPYLISYDRIAWLVKQ
jgi:hypothetical protein